MMQNNALSQQAREQAYKAKFSKFEEDMKRKLDWYQANVTNPKQEQARLQSERQRMQVQ